MIESFNMIKLYNGDCLDILKSIEDKTINLVVTDPPYTMTKHGKSCRPNYMKNNMGEDLFNGTIPNAEQWFKEVYRVLKDDTHFYTFVNINDIQNYLNVAKQTGFKLHNIISMIKDTNMPNRWYLKQTELILFFRKGKAKPINDMTSRDNIKVVMPKQSNGKLHITQKPLDLIEKLVYNSSNENDLVLDLYMGSGTTGVACKNLNRQFIGIELNKEYYDIAKDRLSYECYL